MLQSFSPCHSRLRRRLPGKSVLALALVAALAANGAVHAGHTDEIPGQDTTDTADDRIGGVPQQAPDADATELDSVMVTARRHEERMVDVPISMSAMTGVEIERLGLKNVADVISMTPGAASISNGGGFTQVQLRGVSTSLGGNANGYYLDGVPFTGVTVPWYPDARSWDIDRVEVLKGPQGTTFGEGSMGGTVRIITRKPVFNEVEGAIDLSGSSTRGGGNGWGTKAMVNLPLVEDKLALRLDGTNETVAGWIDDAKTGKKNINENRIKTGRVKLRYAPTDRLDINFSYWKYWLRADDGSNQALDDMTAPSYSSAYAPWDVKTAVATYDFDESQLFYAWGESGLLQSSHGTIIPDQEYDSRIDLNVRTQELRWSSTGERTLDWTVGYYLRKAERADQSRIGDMAPSGSKQTNDGYAVYGETILKLPDPRWSVTTGLRYFSDDVHARSSSEDDAVTMNARFSSWNPRLGLSFKSSEDTLYYVSAAKGFRSGQLQPITSYVLAQGAGLDLPVQIDPDSITTYELGAKSQFDDGRLVVEGDVFYSDWKKVAVRVPLNETFNGLINSRGTRNRGVEFNLTYSPTPSLTLQLGGSYIDAVYVADIPDTPLNKGTPVYNVPKKTLDGSVGWRHPVGQGLDFVAHGALMYSSARETPLTDGTPGDSITRVDARAGIESLSGWALYLFGNNLTNEDGAVDARYMDGTATRLQPRTMGVQFRYNY